MHTQFDYRARIVSLDNLHAMCARISGMSHTFTVTKVSRSRAHVEYSNPNEYGAPNPVTAVYPCYPMNAYVETGTTENPSVVLDALRFLGDRDGDGYQAFDQLTASPTLWRNDGRWESHAEINTRLEAAGKPTTVHSCGCMVCDVPKPEVSK